MVKQVEVAKEPSIKPRIRKVVIVGDTADSYNAAPLRDIGRVGGCKSEICTDDLFSCFAANRIETFPIDFSALFHLEMAEV